MGRITDEEMDRLLMDERHSEIVSVLNQAVVRSDVTDIGKLLARQSIALERIAQLTAAHDFRGAVKEMSKNIEDLKKALVCKPKKDVYTVVRDSDGLIKEVIRTTNEQKKQ